MKMTALKRLVTALSICGLIASPALAQTQDPFANRNVPYGYPVDPSQQQGPTQGQQLPVYTAPPTTDRIEPVEINDDRAQTQTQTQGRDTNRSSNPTQSNDQTGT